MLWEKRKQKLINVIKQNLINRLRREGVSYDAIGEALANLHPDTLMIGFARRFATYKRATLIFKDLERITQILNNFKTTHGDCNYIDYDHFSNQFLAKWKHFPDKN